MTDYARAPQSATKVCPSQSGSVVAFSFEGHEVRGFDHQGEPHFIGNEVAEALGYASPKDAVSAHCKSLKLLKSGELALLGIKSGPRGMNVIPERDVYRLVMRSNLPTAEAFEEKVVGEILPSIRKTGGYMVAAADETPEVIMARALVVAQDTLARQRSENDKLIEARAEALATIKELSPKADAHDYMAEQPGDLGVRDAGRELRVGQQWVTDYIDDHDWSCVEGKKRKPAHYGLKMGYCRFVRKLYPHPHTGEEMVREEFRLTSKGIARLAEIIAKIRKENSVAPFAKTPERAL